MNSSQHVKWVCCVLGTLISVGGLSPCLCLFFRGISCHSTLVSTPVPLSGTLSWGLDSEEAAPTSCGECGAPCIGKINVHLQIS